MSKIINGPRYAAFIVLCAIVVSPVLLVDIPAMSDYPQHLARMYILATAGTPAANPYYDVTWKFYPNLAMELLVPALASILSVEAATKAFLILSQILIVTGAMALEATVKGRQQLAALAALALLYSFPFAWGFLNFQFGMGVALWGITAWVAMANRDIVQRFAVHTMLATALYTAHFFAFGIYGAVIGFYELWQFNERRDVRKVAWTVAVLANP